MQSSGILLATSRKLKRCYIMADLSWKKESTTKLPSQTPTTKGNAKEQNASNVRGLSMDLAGNGCENGTSTPSEKDTGTILPAPTHTNAGTIPPSPTEITLL